MHVLIFAGAESGSGPYVKSLIAQVNKVPSEEQLSKILFYHLHAQMQENFEVAPLEWVSVVDVAVNPLRQYNWRVKTSPFESDLVETHGCTACFEFDETCYGLRYDTAREHTSLPLQMTL